MKIEADAYKELFPLIYYFHCSIQWRGEKKSHIFKIQLLHCKIFRSHFNTEECTNPCLSGNNPWG